jgi:hypothetical protein
MQQKAAERLASYWEQRRSLFGSHKYFLPLTLNGALRDDRVALEVGFMQLVPGLDVSGRQIIFISIPKHTREGYSSMSAVRFCFIFDATFVAPILTLFDFALLLDASHLVHLPRSSRASQCHQRNRSPDRRTSFVCV